MSLRKVTLATAAAKLGVREEGSNSGEAVKIFQNAAGIKPGQPWCAAFVNWAAEQGAKQLGVLSPLEKVPLQGLVQSYVDYGIEHEWVVAYSNVLPGDLFCLFDVGLKRYAHIGFVESKVNNENAFMTVEGNSNDEGHREGVEVCCRKRKVKANTLFLRWTKVVETAPTKPPVVKKP